MTNENRNNLQRKNKGLQKVSTLVTIHGWGKRANKLFGTIFEALSIRRTTICLDYS